LKKITLGRTGLRVNKLGFGGIPIQKVSERQAVETVLHAVESGVDFIDTGVRYSTSERRIGKALQLTNKNVVLASKAMSKTADGMRKDLEISLRELQRNYIDIYQCHFVKTDAEYDQIISAGGALQGLIAAKEEGLIGHIGISCHRLDLLDRILDEGHFETIMVCFSFLEPAAKEKIIPKAIKKNIGVIAMKPLSGGVIDDAALAIKYVLSQEGIAVICGVEEKTLFDENWNVFLNDDYTLTDIEKQKIKEIRKHHDKRFCRRCDYCQPCSSEIPIQTVLSLSQIVKKTGINKLTDPKRLELYEKMRNCNECGECMTRCPYELPIPKLIKETLDWVEEQLARL